MAKPQGVGRTGIEAVLVLGMFEMLEIVRGGALQPIATRAHHAHMSTATARAKPLFPPRLLSSYRYAVSGYQLQQLAGSSSSRSRPNTTSRQCSISSALGGSNAVPGSRECDASGCA